MLFIFGAASIFTWLYWFNIYEVKIVSSSDSLKVNGNKSVKIFSVPLNSFGKKIPLRNVDTKYEILSGENLVSILKTKEGVLLITPKSDSGTVVIRILPEMGLFPTDIKIKIYE